ncbi:MAG: amidohydrolase [Candidatus Bathyarchaeia archaeon]
MEWRILAKFAVTEPTRVIKDACVVVEGNRIIDVGKERLKKKYPRYEKIEAGDGMVIPGLLNAHTHAAMTLMRGTADDMTLEEWLGKIWPIERGLRKHDVYIGTLLACLEMIRSGTTCFNDMYFFMDAVVKAIGESGMRGVVAYPLIELGDESRGEKDLREGERVVRRFHRRYGRVLCSFGPHAPYSCSPRFLCKVRELADRYGVTIHTHLAETKGERSDVEKAFHLRLGGRTITEFLDEIGFLGDNVLAAHCVWLTEDDVAILAKRGVSVAHNPVSNMKLADGIAPVPKMLAKGVRVGLGTDGAASNNSLDMFEAMKTVALIHKVVLGDPTMVTAPQALGMATVDGAEALHLDDLGSIRKGKKADLVILDLKRPRLTPLHHPVSQIVYAARGSDVETVVIDGKLVMEDRRVLTVDEGDVLEEAERVSNALLERAKEE